MDLQTAQLNIRTHIDTLEPDGDLFTPNDPTFGPRLNDLNRQLIAAQFQTGECWLGRFNPTATGETIQYAKHDGSNPVRNFSCNFLAPKHDQELHQLLLERAASPYQNPSADRVKLERIFLRLRAIGGTSLFWS